MQSLTVSMVSRVVGAAALTAACACSCVSAPLKPEPLSSRQRDRLLRRAQLPGTLGIDVAIRDGNVTFGRAHALPLGAHTTAYFLSRGASHAGLPIIPLRINRRLTPTAIDVSAASSLIDYQAAIHAGVTPVGGIPIGGGRGGAWQLLEIEEVASLGRMSQLLSLATTVRLGDLDIYKVPFGIVNSTHGLSALSRTAGQRVEAVLGAGFLRAFKAVTLDFPNEKMQAHMHPYKPDPRRLVAAMTLRDDHGVPTTRALLGNRKPLYVALATAGGFGLRIPETAAKALNLAPPAGPKAQAGTAAIGPQRLNLSGFELADVPSEVLLPGPDETAQTYAYLGTAVLGRYVVTIDFASQKIFFESP